MVLVLEILYVASVAIAITSLAALAPSALVAAFFPEFRSTPYRDLPSAAARVALFIVVWQARRRFLLAGCLGLLAAVVSGILLAIAR